VRGQCHVPAAFYPGKHPVPIVQEAGWAPGPVWTGAENLAPTGIRSPDRPARSQSLYRLRYPAHGEEGGDLKIPPFPPFMDENGLKWAERKHYRVDEKRRILVQTDTETFPYVFTYQLFLNAVTASVSHGHNSPYLSVTSKVH
jgi:hypothetical protein